MEEKTVAKVTLTQREAEEYCAYKRQKKISEIMAALRRSESELTQNDSAVKLGEQALRLRQAAVKMTPSELISRGEAVRRLGVKADCIVGGNGETFASVKAYEAKRAIKEGAKEITLVLTPSLIANCRYTELRKEIKAVRKATKRTLLKARVEKIIRKPLWKGSSAFARRWALNIFPCPISWGANGCNRALPTVVF